MRINKHSFFFPIHLSSIQMQSASGWFFQQRIWGKTDGIPPPCVSLNLNIREDLSRFCTIWFQWPGRGHGAFEIFEEMILSKWLTSSAQTAIKQSCLRLFLLWPFCSGLAAHSLPCGTATADSWGLLCCCLPLSWSLRLASLKSVRWLGSIDGFIQGVFGYLWAAPVLSFSQTVLWTVVCTLAGRTNAQESDRSLLVNLR